MACPLLLLVQLIGGSVMSLLSRRSLLCALGLAIGSTPSLRSADAPAEPTPAQVVVVSTLHQLHEGT